MIHRFPCGTLALDFVGTLRARRNDEPTEKLTRPSDLDAWFSESGMLDRVTSASASDLEQAVELREAIYALAYARVTGDELPADAIAMVSDYAEKLPISVSLTDGALERSGTAPQALASLARQTIEIVGGPNAGLLRECSRPECTQVYLDTSRGHRRDWCSMQTCGNRVKAQKFRARQATSTATLAPAAAATPAARRARATTPAE